MNDPERRLADILKDTGYSMTAPRQTVLAYLLGREPVTVATLTKALSPSIDRASVYRTISLFQKLGIVQRLNVGLKYKIELTDMFIEHHHHFTCSRCGAVIPVSERALERFVEKLSAHYGFLAMEHQFEIQGYCKTCKLLAS